MDQPHVLLVENSSGDRRLAEEAFRDANGALILDTSCIRLVELGDWQSRCVLGCERFCTDSLVRAGIRFNTRGSG